MRVFVAGATGVLGRRLAPLLVRAGHEVHGMTRSTGKTGLLEGLGARPVVADALDAEAVRRALVEREPDVVVHQLTAIPHQLNPRRLDREFAQTDRLRTEGTDTLLSAAREAGVRRVVAQSYTGWPYARVGDALKTEEDPLDDHPPQLLRSTLDSIRYLEEAVTGISWGEGLVLRYGAFYGPGTQFALDPPGGMVEAVRRGRLPVIGGGGGVWSFIHVDDAAAATVAAVERGAPGLYNIVDDDPSPVRAWLPGLAEALGAKPPGRVPRWVGRLLAGEATTVMMTEVRGVSNAKAKEALAWAPAYPSWREGFVRGLGAAEGP